MPFSIGLIRDMCKPKDLGISPWCHILSWLYKRTQYMVAEYHSSGNPEITG